MLSSYVFCRLARFLHSSSSTHRLIFNYIVSSRFLNVMLRGQLAATRLSKLILGSSTPITASTSSHFDIALSSTEPVSSSCPFILPRTLFRYCAEHMTWRHPYHQSLMSATIRFSLLFVSDPGISSSPTIANANTAPTVLLHLNLNLPMPSPRSIHPFVFSRTHRRHTPRVTSGNTIRVHADSLDVVRLSVYLPKA